MNTLAAASACCAAGNPFAEALECNKLAAAVVFEADENSSEHKPCSAESVAVLSFDVVGLLLSEWWLGIDVDAAFFADCRSLQAASENVKYFYEMVETSLNLKIFVYA